MRKLWFLKDGIKGILERIINITFMLDPCTSARRICSDLSPQRSLSCFFKPVYFSSIFSRSPYRTGVVPSSLITSKEKTSFRYNAYNAHFTESSTVCVCVRACLCVCVSWKQQTFQSRIFILHVNYKKWLYHQGWYWVKSLFLDVHLI